MFDDHGCIRNRIHPYCIVGEKVYVSKIEVYIHSSHKRVGKKSTEMTYFLMNVSGVQCCLGPYDFDYMNKSCLQMS